MTTLFGIKNCDTVKKARIWLTANACEYRFHDVRIDGLDEAKLDYWIDSVGYQALVNKRSTTWKQLSTEAKDTLCAASAKQLMLEHPTLIKRPVLELGNCVYVGFKDTLYSDYFANT